MVDMRSVWTSILAAAVLNVSCLAMAQGVAAHRTDEIVHSLRLAEHNQLGLLEYCHAQGAINEDIVALQRATIDLLPPADVAGLDKAEAAGRRGIVAFGTSEVSIAQAAMAEGITVESRCKQMALVLESWAGKKLTW